MQLRSEKMRRASIWHGLRYEDIVLTVLACEKLALWSSVRRKSVRLFSWGFYEQLTGQVTRYPKALYKSFNTQEEAERWLECKI